MVEVVHITTSCNVTSRDTCQVLCGVMSGGTWGPNIRQWGSSDSPGGLSHCFLVTRYIYNISTYLHRYIYTFIYISMHMRQVLDPAVCGPGFRERLQSLLDTFRGLEPAEADKVAP